MRVAVCALTYLRPVGLERLLVALAELERPDDVVVDVVVVDNDVARSAEDVVRRHRERSGVDVVYVHAPERSISLARNAAVHTARSLGADAICFIDDDEWPTPRWLSTLVETHVATGADVVTGPVDPSFDEPPPAWVVAGRFFERPRHEDRERIGYATTSNVLVMASAIADRADPFDPAFGLSGGEDTHLFAQLVEAGCSIVWSERSTVTESIPPTRVDRRWILRREFRRGQTLSLSLRVRDPRAVRYLKRIANGLVQIGRGSIELVVGLPQGRAGVVRGLRRVCFGGGMISGLTGRRYQEYATVHGT